VLIKNVVSNFYNSIKKINNFENIIKYIVDNIKKYYPELIDLSTKEKERVLYKPVEKLPRIRSIPVFENFNSIFVKNLNDLYNATN